jgi:hypothetical protein
MSTEVDLRRVSTTETRKGTDLADILERVLDKGVVIAGDIRVELLDIELLTIRLRLLVAGVDKAREMGISWWEEDPFLTSTGRSLVRENELLKGRLAALEARLDAPRVEPPVGLRDERVMEPRNER